MKKLRMLSLCSGIGGVDLAAEWTGEIEIVGQVEINTFCQSVLSKHWPSVLRLSDIKDVRGDEFGAIDIVAGGIPCQPFSSAGKRRGVEDDRHLWPYAFAIVQQARPRWVLIENVRNFVPLALDLLLADVEPTAPTMDTTSRRSDQLRLNGKIVLLFIDRENAVVCQTQEVQRLCSPCRVLPDEFFSLATIPVLKKRSFPTAFRQTYPTRIPDVASFCRRYKCGAILHEFPKSPNNKAAQTPGRLPSSHGKR